MSAIQRTRTTLNDDEKLLAIMQFLEAGYTPSEIDKELNKPSDYAHSTIVDTWASKNPELFKRSMRGTSNTREQAKKQQCEKSAPKRLRKRAQQFNRVVARRYVGQSVRRVDVWSA